MIVNDGWSLKGWGKSRVAKMRMLRWMYSQQPHKTGTKSGMIVHERRYQYSTFIGKTNRYSVKVF